jgi:hypothetical protein
MFKKSWYQRHKLEITTIGELAIPIMIKCTKYLLKTVINSIRYLTDNGYRAQVDLERWKIWNKNNRSDR